MTDSTLRVLSDADIDGRTKELIDAGVRILIGTYVDNAGIFRAKQVPVTRTGSFHRPGLGASASWAVFAVDDHIAFTPSFSVVGDMRLRADLDALRILSDGLAWAPLELADQYGVPIEHCARGVLRRQQSSAEVDGFEVLAAFEIEFTCFDQGTANPTGGPAYGARSLIDHAPFLRDVHALFESAGLAIEQVHAEYGTGQMELTMQPSTPLEAVDNYVVARILLGIAARRHQLQLSYSPKPQVDGVGLGAHLHFSMTHDGAPIFSGGDGPHGLTNEGQCVVGGLVKWLPESMGVLAPSLLSLLRLQPGMWSGAYACWGLENREAAIRLCAATPGNPYGANVEVKCIDHTGNPYATLALLLGLARTSIVRGVELPGEITVDPDSLSDDERVRRGVVRIGAGQRENLSACRDSVIVSEVLGPQLVEAIVSVRNHELDLTETKPISELVERFRFTWSV